ncbi:peptidase C39 [Xenorhabdus mauleonii]|uniref:Peptidase C39 n=1 Tax=Xenorhabdus mauleonii TaxID=351675 RepID=A0A1I3MWS1_9GAMM|nr:peptidase C39 [Xenorhabdus mauleonii]SFJ01574.1 hypothetical protein SAMN05421680_10516 [Xenorhabdus mauleonii]
MRVLAFMIMIEVYRRFPLSLCACSLLFFVKLIDNDYCYDNNNQQSLSLATYERNHTMGITIDRDYTFVNTLSFALDYPRLLLQCLSSNQALTQSLYTASPDIFPTNELETRWCRKMILSSFRRRIDFLAYVARLRWV